MWSLYCQISSALAFALLAGSRSLTSHSDKGTQQHSILYVEADLTHQEWAAYFVQD